MTKRIDSAANCILSITPTVCALMDIPGPTLSLNSVIAKVIRAAEMTGITKVDRCLLYTPDAVGAHLCSRHSKSFEGVSEYAPTAVRLLSVFPPKTPVCYASMFTGALPESHGIRKYEKSVIRCDTLFDALVRARKQVAIVAVAGSSMDLVFRERAIDYFCETGDDDVTARTIALLRMGKHDFIVAYHQEYDDTLHQTDPQSPEAVAAMENHIRSFGEIARALELHWKQHNRLIMFAPDHGAHVDPATGRGTHGENIPEDMYVQHFFGFRRSEWDLNDRLL